MARNRSARFLAARRSASVPAQRPSNPTSASISRRGSITYLSLSKETR
jgi:hypothetical protein